MTPRYENFLKSLSADERAAIEKLNVRMRAQLATLQEPGLREKVEAIFEANGKIEGKRPKAGFSY